MTFPFHLYKYEFKKYIFSLILSQTQTQNLKVILTISPYTIVMDLSFSTIMSTEQI